MIVQLFVQTLFIGVAALITLCYMGKGRLIHRKALELYHGKPGCVPVADVGNVTIHYFAASGRAEVLRLIMEDAQIPYNETGYTGQEWPQIKKKGTSQGLFPFGQVPVIETSTGESLAQSQAIAHFLGRSVGLDCDCEDYAFCEMLVLGAADVREKLAGLLRDRTHTLADRDRYFKVLLPIWFGYLEKLAPPLSNQLSAYFAGGRLTWVDFVLFDVIDYNVRGGIYDYGDKNRRVDVLAKFPKLNNFYKTLARRPNLSEYLNSKRRYPFVPLYQPRDAAKAS